MCHLHHLTHLPLLNRTPGQEEPEEQQEQEGQGEQVGQERREEQEEQEGRRKQQGQGGGTKRGETGKTVRRGPKIDTQTRVRRQGGKQGKYLLPEIKADPMAGGATGATGGTGTRGATGAREQLGQGEQEGQEEQREQRQQEGPGGGATRGEAGEAVRRKPEIDTQTRVPRPGGNTRFSSCNEGLFFGGLVSMVENRGRCRGSYLYSNVKGYFLGALFLFKGACLNGNICIHIRKKEAQN